MLLLVQPEMEGTTVQYVSMNLYFKYSELLSEIGTLYICVDAKLMLYIDTSASYHEFTRKKCQMNCFIVKLDR